MEELKTGGVNERGQIVNSAGSVVGAANPLDVPPSINSSALEATTSYSLPNAPISTEAAGLSTFASTYAKTAKAQQDALAQKTSEAEIAKNEEKKGLFKTVGEFLGILESRPALEQEAGLDVKAQKVTDYTNQIEAMDRAELNELRALEGQGLTDVQLRDRKFGIQAKYAFPKADLALLQAAANRDYETAFNILDRKVQLKLEPLKVKLEFQKMFYDENKALFDKAEQREFDSLIKASDREYNEEKATQEGIASLISTALQNGVQIPQRVLSELNKARSTAEATQILSRNGISLESEKDRLATEKLRYEVAQLKEPGTGVDAPLYDGLSSKTATAVRGIVSGFKSEPQLTNFATVQDGYNFTQLISDKTTNPADDQALIYALAKVLDPNSVVREGEYATAQKYAQSWVKAYGKSITQAIAGTGFLSQEARANIKKVIETKYKSSKVSYDNLYDQYAKQINNLTGRDDGTKFLREYAVQTSGVEIPKVDVSQAKVSGLKVTFPGGGTLTFPNQTSLSKFMQDNGL